MAFGKKTEPKTELIDPDELAHRLVKHYNLSYGDISESKKQKVKNPDWIRHVLLELNAKIIQEREIGNEEVKKETKRADNLQRELQDLEKRVNQGDSSVSITALQAELDKAKQDLIKKTVEVDVHKELLSNRDSSSTDLLQEVKEKENEVLAKTEELRSQVEIAKGLELQLQTATDELAEEKERCRKAGEQNLEWQRALAERDEKVSDLESAISELENTKSNFEQKCSALEAEKSSLQEDDEQIKQNHQAALLELKSQYETHLQEEHDNHEKMLKEQVEIYEKAQKETKEELQRILNQKESEVQQLWPPGFIQHGPKSLYARIAATMPEDTREGRLTKVLFGLIHVTEASAGTDECADWCHRLSVAYYEWKNLFGIQDETADEELREWLTTFLKDDQLEAVAVRKGEPVDARRHAAKGYGHEITAVKSFLFLREDGSVFKKALVEV